MNNQKLVQHTDRINTFFSIYTNRIDAFIVAIKRFRKHGSAYCIFGLIFTGYALHHFNDMEYSIGDIYDDRFPVKSCKSKGKGVMFHEINSD